MQAPVSFGRNRKTPINGLLFLKKEMQTPIENLSSFLATFILKNSFKPDYSLTTEISYSDDKDSIFFPNIAKIQTRHIALQIKADISIKKAPFPESPSFPPPLNRKRNNKSNQTPHNHRCQKDIRNNIVNDIRKIRRICLLQNNPENKPSNDKNH